MKLTHRLLGGAVLALFICGMALGVAILRPLPGQTQQLSAGIGIFPRESDLWSVSANDPGVVWDGGFGGWIVTIQKDANGRLPALTTLYTMENSSSVYRDVNGRWVYWLSAGSNGYNPVPVQFEVGLVLQPGRYLFRGAPSDSSVLLAIGYWARP